VGLLDDAVGIPGPLGDGVDGALEDLSLAARHSRMVGGSADSASGRGNAERGSPERSGQTSAYPRSRG
jgi:hypothetical protein